MHKKKMNLTVDNKLLKITHLCKRMGIYYYSSNLVPHIQKKRSPPPRRTDGGAGGDDSVVFFCFLKKKGRINHNININTAYEFSIQESIV